MVSNISGQQANQPFRVLSRRGYTIGKFWRLELAVFALRNWTQAVSIIRGNCVLARRNKSRIILCQSQPATATKGQGFRRVG